jgi:hypothetical protein
MAPPPVEDARERIAQLVATLCGFLTAAGADAAVLVLDQGEGAPPLLVECPAEGPATLSEGDQVVQLDPARLAAAPLPLPDVRALAPFDVDALRAEITAPLGGVEQLARAVRELADALPGRSVLSVTFATSDPEAPLRVSARSGDPLVLGLGDEQFEMGPGWP